MSDVKFLVKSCLICLIISLLWIGLEYLLDGEVKAQNSDTVITVLISLYLAEHLNVRKE